MIELRPDQREIAKKLVEMLKTKPAPWVALQAPTGWGKTLTVLAAIRELGAYPALWLVPRLSIGVHVYRHAIDVGLRALLTAGKEKLCPFGFSLIDFTRGVCHRCSLNRPISLGELGDFGNSMDFGEIKVLGESRQICPYKVQDFLEKQGHYNIVVAHYGRARKLGAVKPRVVVVDEGHNVSLPTIHQIDVRALSLLLEKIGFSEPEASGLIKSPEVLKVVLSEMLDVLMMVEDEELRPLIETIISVLILQTGQSVWYFDPTENTINIIELPDVTFPNVRAIIMSATLPPSLLNTNTNATIIVRRGWAVPVRIDGRYTLSYEGMMRRREEVGRYVAERYLKPSTVVFTTTAREDLLPIDRDGIVWEDEITDSPCRFRDKTIVLRVYGRFAEGVDLDCFENLVLLGLPVLPPAVMRRLEARGIGWRDLVVTKVVQIIGRVIRSPTPPDKMPNIYLVDKRFHQFKDDLKNYEIEVIND